MKQHRENVIPMTVPAINNQQPMFDMSQAIDKRCECGSDCFDKVFKIGLISRLAPGNKAQKDIILEVPVYVCHGCGKELNPLENKEKTDAG